MMTHSHGRRAAVAASLLLSAALLAGCAQTAASPRQAMAEAIDPSHEVELVSIEVMGTGPGERGVVDAPKESQAAGDLVAALAEERCSYLRSGIGVAWDDGVLYTVSVRDAETQADYDQISFTADGKMHVESADADYSLAEDSELYKLSEQLYNEAREGGEEPW